MQFVINQNDYCNGYDADQDYGEWETIHNITFDDAYIVENGRYADVILFPGEVEPQKGDVIHVVAVTYDTGNSFGREYGCKCFLWAFTDANKAHALADLVRQDAFENPDDFTNLEFEGVMIENYTWKGYFEEFCGVDVDTLRIVR